MFGKINFLFILLHIYVITYLIVTVVGASDLVMQVMHVVCPFVVLPFLYHTLKSSANTAPAHLTEESEEGYKAL